MAMPLVKPFSPLPYSCTIDNDNGLSIANQMIQKYQLLFENMNWEKTQTVLQRCNEAGSRHKDITALCLLCMLTPEFNGAVTREELVKSNWSGDILLARDMLEELTKDRSVILPMVPVKCVVPTELDINTPPEGYKIVLKIADSLSMITFPEPLKETITLKLLINETKWSYEVDIPAGTTKWSFPEPIIVYWLQFYRVSIKGLPEDSTLWGCLMTIEDRDAPFKATKQWVVNNC